MGGGLILRADADARIGTGHAMRCLALGQAWLDAGRGPVELLASALTESVGARYQREGIGVVRVAPGAGALGSLLAARPPGWVVLDGYALGLEEQRAARAAGHRLAVIDDDAAVGQYLADLVVDANVFADEAIYAGRAPGARLLVGPRYALLRREIRRRSAEPERPAAAGERVLVAFGGADPPGISERALRALASVDARVTLVVGPANPRRAALERAASETGHAQLVFDVPNFRDVAEGAALALVAAGTTCLELAYLGVPQIVVVTADNQRRVAEGLSARGAARLLGEAAALDEAALRRAVVDLLGDEAARRALAERGRELVDGQGTSRVIAAMSGPGR